eukprot:m.574341 g.574341  ORF g.574341 m.574341 type:complete len:70 (+) comp57883_c0_seq60:86-295(+)
MTTGESADLQCRLESREWSVQSVQTNPANILLVLLKKSGFLQLIAVQRKLVSVRPRFCSGFARHSEEAV